MPHRPSRREIAEQDRYQLERQRIFRVAADAVTAGLARFDEIEAVALFGSVAVPLWREVPRFREFRRYEIEVWHECKDTDRYLGRLCHFSTCPKGKIECLVPGCGREPFLKQHKDFKFARDALAEGRVIRLYDKKRGILHRADDIPVVGTTA